MRKKKKESGLHSSPPPFEIKVPSHASGSAIAAPDQSVPWNLPRRQSTGCLDCTAGAPTPTSSRDTRSIGATELRSPRRVRPPCALLRQGRSAVCERSAKIRSLPEKGSFPGTASRLLLLVGGTDESRLAKRTASGFALVS